MKPALYDTVIVDIETLIQSSPTIYLFRATGSTLRFAGFLKVYGVDADAEEGRSGAGKPGGRGAAEQGGEKTDEGLENEAMPDLAVGDPLILHQLLPKQHFTQPPSRYTEAQLIGALKKLGLGRPSTYATIVETLKERKYVALAQKRLYPTPLGFQVCQLLEKHIQMVVDIGFTAGMEENLDRIARGQVDRLTVMREFYGPFRAMVDQAMAAAAAERQPAARVAAKSGARKQTGKTKALPKSEKAGQTCPQCGEGTLVVKRGKFGAFLGCSRYALGCQYTENIPGAGKSRKRSWSGQARKKK
jgi:DNA topoisomerase-1